MVFGKHKEFVHGGASTNEESKLEEMDEEQKDTCPSSCASLSQNTPDVFEY